MPVYKITDPATGKKVKLTGDSPPTEQELEEVFAQVNGGSSGGLQTDTSAELVAAPAVPTAPTTSPISQTNPNWLKAVGQQEIAKQEKGLAEGLLMEVPVQMVTGALGASAGGWAGLGTILTGGGSELAADRSARVANAMTIQPKTEAGKAASEAIAWPFEKGTEIAGKLGGAAGAQYNGQVGGKGEAAGEALGKVGFQSLAVLAGRPWRAGAEVGPNLTLPKDPVALNALLNKTVKTGFDKGIKPAGTLKTRKLIEEEAAKEVEAVKSIINSKDGLKFRDDYGDIVAGRVPQSLDELSQAVAQRKVAAFDAYNTKQLEVGAEGIRIPLDSTIKALEGFAADPVINNHTPGAAAYAVKSLERLQKQESYTPGDAQRAMAILNQSMEAYRKNPTAENASVAGADAIVANTLRERLNNIVEAEAPSGPGYQALKKEFGAVKSIEGMVNNRLRKSQQQAGKSALNFYDVFSANDLIQGVLTGNPVIAAKGAGLAWIARKIKRSKDPDIAVKEMFQKSERIMERIKKYTPKEEAAKIVAGVELLLPKDLQIPQRTGDGGALQQVPMNQLAAMGGRGAQQPPVGSPGRHETLQIGESSQRALPAGTSSNRLALPDSPRSGQAQLPAGQGFELVDPANVIKPPAIPEQVPGVVNAYERMFQIAQSPEGMRLLVERLGREEKYTQLLDELLKVPQATNVLPMPVGVGEGFNMIGPARTTSRGRNAQATRARNRKTNNLN